MSTVGAALRLVKPTLDRVIGADGLDEAGERQLRTTLAGFPDAVVDRVVDEVRETSKPRSLTPAPPVPAAAPARTTSAAQTRADRISLALGATQVRSLPELRRQLAGTPPGERLALAHALLERGVPELLLTLPRSAEREEVLAFFVADRQRTLAALSRGAPEALFSDASLAGLRDAGELLVAITAKPELAPRLVDRLLAVPGAQQAIVEVAHHDALPTALTRRALPGLSPHERDVVLRSEARHLGQLFEQAGKGRVELAERLVKSGLLSGVDSEPAFVVELLRQDLTLLDHLDLGRLPAKDLLEVLEVSSLAWSHLPAALRRDPEFQRAALTRAPAIIRQITMRDELHPTTLEAPLVVLRLAGTDGLPDPLRPEASWSLLELTPPRLREDPAFLRRFFLSGGAARGVPAESWTAELAELAVLERGMNLLHVPRALWTVDLVASALQHENEQEKIDALGEALAEWPGRASTETQRHLIAHNALILPWLDPAWRDSRELAESIAATQGAALVHFAFHLRQDPELVTLAAQDNPAVLDSLDLDLGRPEYRALAKRVAERHPALFEDIFPGGGAGPDILRAAAPGMAHGRRTFRALDLDARLARELFSTQIGVTSRLPERLRKDPELMLDAVRAFPPLLDDLPEGSVPRAVLVGMSPGLAALARSYKERLEHAGISDPFRFANRATLDAILAVRERGDDGKRPRALVIMARNDPNLAFRVNQLPELAQRYAVHYYEVASDHELTNAWRDVGSLGAPLGLVVIGGHGRRTVTILGDPEPGRTVSENDSPYLDFSDGEKLRRALAGVRYAKDAVLILDSCSVGTGSDRQANLATLMAEVTGLRTFAPTVPIASSVWIDGAGKPRPAFEGGAFQTHVAYPSSE